jgi:hypothetical protein
MRSEIRGDFERSARALRDVVFPALQASCPDFHSMEIEVLSHHRDRLHHDLDTIAGIDAYLRSPLVLRTIAARVQYGGSHRTFTIRVARPNHAVTELQKRLNQLAGRDSGMLYPYWTLHAYLSADGTTLARAGLAKTSELYFWIAQQFATRDPHERRGPFASKVSREKERFLVVPWDTYRISGHYFFEYTSTLVQTEGQ